MSWQAIFGSIQGVSADRHARYGLLKKTPKRTVTGDTNGSKEIKMGFFPREFICHS